MNKLIFNNVKMRSALLLTLSLAMLQSCVPKRDIRTEKTSLPESFDSISGRDTINSANMQWKEFFNDADLSALIDTALVNNQELNIMLQQVDIAKNEIQSRKENTYLLWVLLPLLRWKK